METLAYDGEKRNWNFEQYSDAHASIHARMEELEAHGYKGLDDGSKVRRFLAGIRTDDLDTCKNAILNDPVRRRDFTQAVRLIKDFMCLKASSYDGTNRNLSEVGKKVGREVTDSDDSNTNSNQDVHSDEDLDVDSDEGSTDSNLDVDVRWYHGDEWRAMSETGEGRAKQNLIRQARKKGYRANKKAVTKKANDQKVSSKMKGQLEELKRQVAELRAAKQAADQGEQTNWNNRNLQR